MSRPVVFGLKYRHALLADYELVHFLQFLQQDSPHIQHNGIDLYFQVTKDFHPEEEVIEFLKNVNATLIVVATRGKHGFEGLFHSSFTDYMVKFAPCDVFVVRPEVKAPDNK